MAAPWLLLSPHEVIDPDRTAATRLHVVTIKGATEFCKTRGLRAEYFRKMLPPPPPPSALPPTVRTPCQPHSSAASLASLSASLSGMVRLFTNPQHRSFNPRRVGCMVRQRAIHIIHRHSHAHRSSPACTGADADDSVAGTIAAVDIELITEARWSTSRRGGRRVDGAPRDRRARIPTVPHPSSQ